MELSLVGTGLRFTLSAPLSFILVSAKVDLYVSRIGPKWSNSNYNGTVGPICDRSSHRDRTTFKYFVFLS